MKANKELYPILSLVLAGLAFASYGVWSRMTADYFGLFFQALSRMIIITFVLGIFLSISKRLKPIAKQDRKWFLIIFTFLSIVTPFYYYAVITLPLGAAIFLFYSGSLTMSFFIGAVFLKEKLKFVNILSLILAFLGMILIFWNQLQFNSVIAIASAIMAGAFFGAYTVSINFIKEDYHPLNWQFWGAVVQIVLYTVAMFVTKESNNFIFPSIAWFGATIFAFAEIIATINVYYGFKNLPAKKASLLLLTEILFAVIFGWLFYKEIPPLLTFFGGVLIIIAMSLPNLDLKFMNRKYEEF